MVCMSIARSSLLYLLGIFVFVGCPSDPQSPADETGTDDGPDVQCDIPALMIERCNGEICHGSSGTPAADLDLVSPGVEERISGAQGVNCSGLIADSADPEGSLLYSKVATPTCGAPMPLGGAALTADELTCMRQFISGLLPPGEGCTDCMCEPGTIESCYEGPEDTIDVGSCQAGTHTCQISGLDWSSCEGQVLPRGEDCNTPEDENCDGLMPACSETWSVNFVGHYDQIMRSVAFDDNGDVVGFGDFEDIVSFGGDPLTAVPSVPPKTDVVLTRHDHLGNPISAEQYGDNSTQNGINVIIDDAGNMVCLIRIYGSIDTGGGSAKSHGGMDVYVFKLDSEGNHVWSRMFGGPDADRAERMVVDGNGDVIITGTFTDNAEFNEDMLISAGLRDAFVLKLDGATGDSIWLQHISGVEDDYGFGVAVASDDEIFIAGRFGASIVIGSENLVSAGDRDIYLARLDGSGNPVWAKSFGGPGLDEVHDVVYGDQIVMLGSISETVDFGGGPLVSAGMRDMYVATFDSDGNHVWSQAWGDAVDQFETDGPNTWPDMTLDAAGNIHVGGSLWGSMDFGNGNVLTAAGDSGNPDVLHFALTPEGDYIGGNRFGGSGTDQAFGIAVSPEGYIALAGRSLGSSVDFGEAGVIHNWEPSDGFIVKLAPL